MSTATQSPSSSSTAPAVRGRPFALLAQYENPADAMHAAEQIRDAGYRMWDVHSPFPVHGMDAAMGLKNSKVGYFTFVGGCTGFTIGMSMIWAMNSFDYPIVVGGKPLFSPLYAFPVSYELTILLSAFGTLFGMFFLNRLPKWYNPLFKNRRFELGANHDKFFIAIETSDPRYSEVETRRLLESTGSRHIELVEE
jgi:hypothetical protein